jgi:hypothetical protein
MQGAAMNAQGFGRHIQDQINGWPDGEPITTAAVASGLAAAFSMDADKAKKITNVTLKRFADKGGLTRIRKGIYGKVKVTPFGRLTPNADEMISGFLLRDGDNVIGYIAGPTLLNAIGLCSWMPKERHIVTNNYRSRLPAGAPIRVYKPVITVDTENAPYLQAIEAFTAMDKYPVDAERAGDILRGMLRDRHISNERLIWYARKHYRPKTLMKTIDIALGETVQ